MGNDFKTTGVLLAIAVVLSLYAYFFETGAEWKEHAVGGVFTHIDPDDVVELELTPGPGADRLRSESQAVPVRLRREADRPGELPRWRIVEPFEFPAFHPRVESMVRSIVELQRIKSIPPSETAAYMEGEDAVFMTLRFRTDDSDASWRRIVMGRDHPDPTYQLVCVRTESAGGEVETFLTRKKFRLTMNSTLDDLRSRALFPVPKERALSLEVKRADRPPLRIEREEGQIDWRLLPPARGVADRKLVNGLLDDLNSWRIESFVTDTPAPPGKYGFDRPRLTVALSDRSGRTHHYEIGDDPQGELDGEVYVRDPGRPFVFTARSDLVERLELPAEEYRSRFFLQLGAGKIVEVEGETFFGGEKREFRLWQEQGGEKPLRGVLREKEDDIEGEWKVEDRHRGETYEADRTLVALVIRALSALPVRRYLDSRDDVAVRQTLSRPPELTLSFRLDTDVRYTIEFRQPGEDLDPPRYSRVVTRDGSEEIALVSTSIPRDLAEGGIALRNRAVSDLEFEEINHFSVLSFDGIRWDLRRLGGFWRIGETDQVRLRPNSAIREPLVEKALRGLTRDIFRVEAFLPDEENLERLELVPGKNQLEVRVHEVRDRVFRSLTIGAHRSQSPGQEYYCRLSNVDMPVLVSPEIIKPLLDLAGHLDDVTERR